MEFPWRVKQRQADEHLGRFAKRCAEYVATADLGLRNERDPETGIIRVRLHADSEPPLALGATIGDVLHNLRSALDSVAWDVCQRAGVPAEREKDVYFPIGTNPSQWRSLSGSQLPSVATEHLEVFRRLQPWFWDEEARSHGVDVNSAADLHPLAQLHRMARVDRHRVPHPVLARAGHTWLGHDEGVEVDLLRVNYWATRPGDVVAEWRIDPPESVADVDPDGEAILALSEEGAQHHQTALDELRAMQQAVVQAIRTIEIEVLKVVSSADLDGLGRLDQELRQAQEALHSLVLSEHVIDRDYIERHRRAVAAEQAARSAYLTGWRELFE